MTTIIALADLTHTGQIVAANTIPLGASMIAAYLKSKLGQAVDITLFRYPEKLSAYLVDTKPDILAFSNFSWNVNLSNSFAEHVKARWPGTITLFGGPNYPDDPTLRREFFARYGAVDFHCNGEGEYAFLEFYRILEEHDFRADEIRRQEIVIPNIDYMSGDKLISGPMLPRIQDIQEIPSPYLMGLNDEFFDDALIPMIQTSRGCPYSCTFCHEGTSYFTKVKRLDQTRIEDELKYIAERVIVPDFLIVDSNFGMFEQDIDTCHYIRDLQNQFNWPRYVFVTTAKNHKSRVIEAASILPGAINPGAAIQTTDETVLANIKRKNLPAEAIVDIARTSETENANSFSEIILCLPGDTKKAHMKSVFDMVDLGIHYIRMYQFMLLPGTEGFAQSYRDKFSMETRFRVLPRCFGEYEVFGNAFEEMEFEEICISNETMSFSDYLECRSFNLTVEIFYNGGIFEELFQLLKHFDIKASQFLLRIHETIRNDQGIFRQHYDAFQEDELSNHWRSPEEIMAFFAEEGVYEKYKSGQHGSNEIYAYRAKFVFEMMREIHVLAFETARELLRDAHDVAHRYADYLNELEEYSLYRKESMLDTDTESLLGFGFDFVALERGGFRENPMDFVRPNGVEIAIRHDDWQRETIKGYLKQYGSTLNGLGRILLRSHVKRLYRSVEYGGQSAN